MGCMEGAAEQQEKVREMMLWSWKGYRCAHRPRTAQSVTMNP